MQSGQLTVQSSIINGNPSRSNSLSLPTPIIINNRQRSNSFTYPVQKENVQNLSPGVISPNISNATLSPLIISETTNSASLSPVIITDTNNATLSPQIISPSVNNASLSPVMISPNLNNASLSPQMLSPNINNATLSSGMISPNINTATLSPVMLSPNINSAPLSPVMITTDINNATLSPGMISPNINNAPLSPVMLGAELNNPVLSPMISPNINPVLSPIMITPSINNSSLAPGAISPNINSTHLPNTLTPNIISNSNSLSPAIISPNINSVPLSPVLLSSNINNVPLSPNIHSAPLSPNINSAPLSPLIVTSNTIYNSNNGIKSLSVDDLSSSLNKSNNENLQVNSLNNVQGFQPNIMTNIIKAIKDTPGENNNNNLKVDNVGLDTNNVIVSPNLNSNNLNNTFNNVTNNINNTSVMTESKSDSSNKNSSNKKSVLNKDNSKKNDKMINNKVNEENKSGKKDDSNKDEIQEFVEDFLMDAFLTSKEIDMEHHKDLFTAPAFDSENNFDQFSMSSFIKQQQSKTDNLQNVDMLSYLNTLKKPSATLDPLLELNKMKNAERPVKSYSNPDIISINNSSNSNNYQTLNDLLKRNANHISSSPSEFVLNKNNNGANNSYLKTATSPLNPASSPNPTSNQYLSPLVQMINNRVLSPAEEEKNPVLSPMGFNAAMFLTSNSMNNSSLNVSKLQNNKDKLSVSSIPNNSSSNHIGSPYNTTPVPSIPSNQSSINSQQSLDSLNIPKNSEILYSPDLNMMIGTNSHKQQSLQLSNNSLNIPRKKVASYPNTLNTTEIDQVEVIMHSPQIINSPLVNSPTSSLNDFDASIRTVSSPQADLTLTNNTTTNNGVDGEVKVVNSLLLNDYNSYLTHQSTNTKKTPSIVLTPSTDSLVIPSQVAIDHNRNIIHSGNSLSLGRNSLTPGFMGENNSLHIIPETLNINGKNDSLRINLSKSDDASSRGDISDISYKSSLNTSESSIANDNLLQVESGKKTDSDNVSEDDSQDMSKSSKAKKTTRKRKTQDKQTASKKKNNTKKKEESNEEISDVSTQESSSNEKQTSNGRVIKYPRIYECKFPGCNKAFTKAHNLRSHERSHMNDRPYSCKYCEKSFVRQYDLLRHERIHTGVKPYVCKKCLAAFSRNDAYNKHIRSCLEKKD